MISDKKLFAFINLKFKNDISRLRELMTSLTLNSLDEVYNLVGNIMSLYIFVVSDSFVERVPEAWESRNISEGILYELDDLIVQLISKLNLPEQGFASYLSATEINQLINQEDIDWDNIARRSDGYIIDNFKIITDISFDDFCKNNDFQLPETKNIINPNLLSGQVAYPGKAIGKVVIVSSSKELDKVLDGDIMVSIMTNVTYTPAFKRAAAVITDEGGITCHAAIVSRELGIPCIIGTKIATKILKDGDMVEVDAERGIVRILEK